MAAVAAHLATGILAVTPDVRIRLAPVADGGEGTLEAALLNGFQARPVRATDPTGRPADAAIGIRGSTAIVELALASGPQLCGKTGLARRRVERHGLATDWRLDPPALGVGGHRGQKIRQR